MSTVSKRKIFGKVLLVILLVVVLAAMLRMVYIIKTRADLAMERRDAAKEELLETKTLAIQLESQVSNLQSDDGLNKVLRERYGLVSENEGYLILLHEHNVDIDGAQKQWWQLW